MTVIRYEHHGVEVAVQRHLAGRHQEYCLCHLCSKFMPDKPNNCPIAEELYHFDVKYNLVTPVWECSEFTKKIQRAEACLELETILFVAPSPSTV